jgi:hypothetical protein
METVMHRHIAVLCLAIVPAVAAATIYKVQMPDGSILFTDSVPPGGKVVEERQPLPAPRPSPKPAPAPRAPAAADSTAGASGGAAPAAGAPATLEAALAEISDAERALAAARKKLEEGREPLPGERIGTARGASRLTPEYESRIAGLEQDVASAEERVKRAYQARNALRN